MRTKLFPLSLILTLAAALLLVACGSEDEPQDVAQDFEVSAEWLTGPVSGENLLAVTLKAFEGEPIEGATVSVDPQMPSMGHGTNMAPVIEEQGGGVYHASFNFTMPGPWVVTIAATKGDQSAELELPVEVDRGSDPGEHDDHSEHGDVAAEKAAPR